MRLLSVLAVIGVLSLYMACGQLPAKSPGTRILSNGPGSSACLEGAAARIERYAQGEVAESEWAETWDCALDSLGQFRRYVSASSGEGYTPEDIRAFANRFLVRDQPVSAELVDSFFALKASLFGGTVGVIRPAEFDRVRDLLVTARGVSLDLLPHLRARARQPSPETLLPLVDAFSAGGSRLAGALETRGNPAFTLSTLETMIREILRASGANAPANLSEQLRAAKQALLAGNRGRIDPAEWTSLIRLLGEYAGSLLAASSALAAGSEKTIGPVAPWAGFWTGLTERLRRPVGVTLDNHRGALPLLMLDQLIDSAPEAMLREMLGLAPERVFDREILKRALRPLATKVLGSRVNEALEAPSVMRIFDEWQRWQRGEVHLERIFFEGNLDASATTRAAFRLAAQAYAARLGTASERDTAEITRLIALSDDYQTLYLNGDAQITYGITDRQTLGNLRKLHAMDLLTGILLRAYGRAPSPGAPARAQVADVRTLISDFQELGLMMSVIDPAIPQLAEKRFRELDLFMATSNGDGFADQRETVYYLTTFLSTRELTLRTKDRTEARCLEAGGGGGPGGERDPLGWRWIDMTCFRAQYFNAHHDLWDHFPEVTRFYESLSGQDQAAFERALEGASRLAGVSDAPIASADTAGYAGILHYVESVLTRFDTDRDGALNLREAMIAFPVFEGALSELSGIKLSDRGTLEAIFTYILKKGRPPSKSILGLAKFLIWRLEKPFWKVSCDRACLYKVFGGLAAPDPKKNWK